MSESEKHFVRDFLVENQAIIYKICRAYSNSNDEFNDLTQEVAFQLWKSKARFKNKSKLSTWVYRVTLNVCMSYIRANKIKTVDISEASALASNNEIEKDDLDILYAALRRLSDNDKAIILLYLEGRKYEEISEIVGLSKNNIGVKITRIRKKLKEIIEEL
ncbi:MAG: sigma-70 family RNA polymerase sigma factor [Ekhidna sp.]|nr:sigma-70 family RNA polymerase sigma factor [Ekhidna sp.]